ncbi:426_t:CDS:1, partial [Gigaspora margarita]
SADMFSNFLHCIVMHKSTSEVDVPRRFMDDLYESIIMKVQHDQGASNFMGH